MMRHFQLHLVFLLVVVSLASCAQTPTSPALIPTPTLSSQARTYLTEALDIMQQHSVNRTKINWTALRRQAFAYANGAKTPGDTYAAIQIALNALGDHHSSFTTPQQENQLGTGDNSPSNLDPPVQRLPHGIGYLELLAFEGSEPTAMHQYVQSAQDAIRSVDQTGTCGWIIDLRIDGGGNMWPMLAAVGPILGEGIAGWFIFPNGVKQAWSYSHGQAQLAGSVAIGIENPAHLKHPNPPVAVLIDHATSSSGEAMAVAFRGRPRTRSFGEPTYGIPTANEGFKLRDGALLLLTVAVDADRTGHAYDSSLIPDELVSTRRGETTDLGVQAATTWLHNQEGC
jgi:carboxyl-terminal processing protease